MRALQLTAYSGPSALTMTELPPPKATASASLEISVHAAGVGFPDLLTTWG